MPKVTGLGGVFFKADQPEELYAWYEKHLGLQRKDGVVLFRWREAAQDNPGTTVFAIFNRDSKYFGPGPSPFMLNFRVDDLDGLLAQLRAAGISIDPKRDDSQFGRFAWITDPEGNRIELWQPPEGQ